MKDTVTCRICGLKRGPLQTAPGGAMVCGDCNAHIKLIKLTRLRGVTEKQIEDIHKQIVDEMEQG